jgi:hypothetical protein
MTALAARPVTAARHALTALLLAALVFEVARHGLWVPAVAGVVAPDLALLLGIGKGLEPGRLHPRAVPAYNAVHRPWGPLALMALATAGLPGLGWFVAGLGWAFHVALDRSAGYGLRAPDGYQRGV